MKHIIRLAGLTALAALTACSQAPAPGAVSDAKNIIAEKAPAAVEAKTAGVLIYADWCGSCKVLDPKVKKVRAMGAVPGLKFITLDYTAKDPQAFYAQADAAGVGDAVKAHFGEAISTGKLLLIDLDDQKVLNTVTKTFEAADIAAAFKDAVAAS